MWHPESIFFALSYIGVIVFGVTTFFQLRKCMHHAGSELLAFLAIVLSVLSLFTHVYETSHVITFEHFNTWQEFVIYNALQIGNAWFRLLLTFLSLCFLRRVNGLQTPFDKSKGVNNG